jgi:CheY-like chemotaxis protein
MLHVGQANNDTDIMVLNEMWRPPLSRNVWRVNVLVVDDDPADAQLIARALRNNTDVREVVVCNSPTKALLDLEAGRVQPTIILLDIRMPQIDGFQFLDSMRLIPAVKDAPVIFLTTSALWRDVRQANGCAISGYIVKPNSYEELKTRLDAVVTKVLSLYK